MKSIRAIVFTFCLLVSVTMLTACASAEPEVHEEINATVVVKTVEVEAEIEEPAEEYEAPVSERTSDAALEEPAQLEPTLPAGYSPPPAISTPTSKPTFVAPTASGLPQLTPTEPVEEPIVERRFVEVEWPPRIRLGESDIVRMSLIPTYEGYTITTDFPEHWTITQTVKIPRPEEYDLYALARLDGVGFTLSPDREITQYLSPGETIIWRWSLTPNEPGQQRISIMLMLRWLPKNELVGPARDVVVYSESLNVQVLSFLGLTQPQALLAGIIGLTLGGSLGIFALVTRTSEPSVTSQTYADVRSPNLDLEIELSSGIRLSSEERTLLQTLFNRYARLLIQSEFLSGYSGARTFLVLPIRSDGRADAFTIAKLGESGAIIHEFENYENYVKDTLPPITARIQQPPVQAQQAASRKAGGTQHQPTATLAALQYTFVGEPGASPTSLKQALMENPEPSLLDKLLEVFGPNWWLQRKPYTFRSAVEYDRVLPTHVVLKPATGAGEILDGKSPPDDLSLMVGDVLTLRNLTVEEIRADRRSQSLIGTSQPGSPPLRVRWLSLEKPQSATGRVIATRETLLQETTKNFDLLGMKDPLLQLPKWLAATVTGSQSTIHGDLNLENILLGPGGLVWLIDFAQTRDGHTLFDFAHLGAEIVAHIFAAKIETGEEYIKMLKSPRESPYRDLYQLFSSLNDLTSHCLQNPSQPREFHLALALSCLGALKFSNLSQHARYFLYITAAFVGQTL